MTSFEDRLKRLEELTASLQDGSLALEEAVRLFEEGMVLAKQLEKELARIEGRIEVLVNEPGKGTEPQFAPFQTEPAPQNAGPESDSGA